MYPAQGTIPAHSALTPKTTDMIDLHTHSDFSDGTLPPEKLIEEAAKSGLRLIALTDHDTAGGVKRAAARARELCVGFLRGIEMEARYEDQLHILGLGIDPESEHIAELIRLQAERREARNAEVLRLLKKDGMDAEAFLEPTQGTVTRANIAAALYRGGYCASVSEAFRLYLGRGKPYFVPQAHPDMHEVLEAIREAGGAAVLAHPMKMKCDHRALIKELRGAGLWGVEAYYGADPDAASGEFSALAREFGLRVTCGSDFHGENRPGVALGCAFRPVPELDDTLRELYRRFPIYRPDAVVRTPVRVKRGFTAAEFQQMAERAAEELPQDFFLGLNGGIVISERAKLHKKSLPQRPLYVMGEYHYGGSEGRYITLYYGSFRAICRHESPEQTEERVKKVLLHEFRHHLETRAGEHDLEYEDDADIASYLEEETSREAPDPGFGTADEPPSSTTYFDPFGSQR